MDAVPGTFGGAQGTPPQRRAESAGSGAAAVRWLRPRVEAKVGLQPESEPAHPLELRWARQVEQRFQQLGVLFGECRVRSVPEVDWMDTSVAVAVEASASIGEARRRFYVGMVAVEQPVVEQIFATPPLYLGRGFADTAALGQQMRAASQRYYESVVGRKMPQGFESAHSGLDHAALKRRVSQTSSEDGSEGENPVVPVAVGNEDTRAQTTDGIVATRHALLSRDEYSRARTTDGARSDVHNPTNAEDVVELREALRQARVHLREALPGDDGAEESVGELGADQKAAVGFATPEPVGSHARAVSPNWDSCGPGTVLRSFPVQDVSSLGFGGSSGGVESDTSSINSSTPSSIGRRTRPARSQYSRVVAAAAEEAEQRLETAVLEAGRLKQVGDVDGARAAAAALEFARQEAEEAQKLRNEVEHAEAQLMLRAEVAEAVSLQDQLQSAHVGDDNSKLQDSTNSLHVADAPLVLSSGRALSMQVNKNMQGEQSMQVVLTQLSVDATSTTARGIGAGNACQSGMDIGSAHVACPALASGATHDPMSEGTSVDTAEISQPQTRLADDENGKSAAHAFGSKAHIEALLSALHTEEATNSACPGSPGLSSAEALRQRTVAKISRQKLVRDMLELAVAEQTKKERRKARLTMPGGRFLTNGTTESVEPKPVDANPLKMQADLWARAQELTGERQKGQRVARALIESFEPVATTTSNRALPGPDLRELSDDARSASVPNNIAATEAWHFHGDGLDYAAVNIPESACADSPDTQLVCMSPEPNCPQVPSNEIRDNSMPPTDARVVRSSSTDPQAVVETVARDKVLQKRAQVEVQEMLARIREKTKRQKSGFLSDRKHETTSDTDSTFVPVQNRAAPTQAALLRHTGAAPEYESTKSLSVQQKARGQVQDVLTKIKRQAKLHASPARRSRSSRAQDIPRPVVQESLPRADQSQVESSSTSWFNASSARDEVHTLVRKSRHSELELISSDALEEQTETACILHPMSQTLKDVPPASCSAEPITASCNDANPAVQNLTDADIAAHDNAVVQHSQNVDVAPRQPSAFATVRVVGNDVSRKRGTTEASAMGENAKAGSCSSNPSLGLRQLDLMTRAGDKQQPSEAEAVDGIVPPTGFLTTAVPRSSLAKDSALPASATESSLQDVARPLTPQHDVGQQRTELVLRVNKNSNEYLSTNLPSVRKRIAESMKLDCKEVDLRLTDGARVTVSVPPGTEELHGHASAGNAVAETMRRDFASACIVAADIVQEQPLCDINVRLRDGQELTTEAQQTIVETVARVAHTDASDVQILGTTHALSADNHHTDRCLTVRMSKPVDEEPSDGAHAAQAAARVNACIAQAISDGSLISTMMNCCGVESSSQIDVSAENILQEEFSPLTAGLTQQEERRQKVRDPSARRDSRRLTEDGLVVGVPVVGAVVRSLDANKGVVQADMLAEGVAPAPSRQTQRRDQTSVDSDPSQHAVLNIHKSAAPNKDSVVLDGGAEAASPGSPEREEFLKRRARAEMQTMLTQIEEKQSSISRTSKNAAGSGVRRRLTNQPLAPLGDIHKSSIFLTNSGAGRHRADTGTGNEQSHSNVIAEVSRTYVSSSEDFDTSQELQVDPHSCGQSPYEPRTPKLAMEKPRPDVKAPRTSTKDAVSAILAQLKSMSDDNVDLSSWTGDMRDLGGAGVDDDIESLSVPDAENLQLSARGLASTKCDDLQSNRETPVSNSRKELTDVSEHICQDAPEATLLRLLADGQICWRILRSIPWQQLRVLQRVSTEFRVACQVVLALRPQAICVGGGNRGRALRSAVAYDSVSDRWSPLASMAVGRINSAVCGLVPGAGILVAGGYNGKGMEASAERLDINSGEWIMTAPMPIGKSGCRGVLLQEAGFALILGGYDQNHQTMARVDAYDWHRDEWNATQFPPMHTARYDCAAGSLPYNRVVVAGGTDADQSWLQSAEVYDHAVRQWSFLPSLGVARDRCAAVGLSLGVTGAATVLVLGGSSHPRSDEASPSENTLEKKSGSPSAPGIVDLSTCEALSLPTETSQSDHTGWIAAPQLNGSRCNFGAVAVGGMVLAIGGEASGTVERLSLSGRGGGWEQVAKLPHPRIGAGAAACPLAAPPMHGARKANEM